jgi:hypothetical protein
MEAAKALEKLEYPSIDTTNIITGNDKKLENFQMLKNKSFTDFPSAFRQFNWCINTMNPGNAKTINDTLEKWASNFGGNAKWREGNKQEISYLAITLIEHEVYRSDAAFNEIEIYTMNDPFWKEIKDSVTQLNVLFDIERPGHLGASFFVIGRVGEDKYYFAYKLF